MFAQSTPRLRPTPTLGLGGVGGSGWLWVEDPGRESQPDQGRSQANCKQL